MEQEYISNLYLLKICSVLCLGPIIHSCPQLIIHLNVNLAEAKRASHGATLPERLLKKPADQHPRVRENVQVKLLKYIYDVVVLYNVIGKKNFDCAHLPGHVTFIHITNEKISGIATGRRAG